MTLFPMPNLVIVAGPYVGAARARPVRVPAGQRAAVMVSATRFGSQLAVMRPCWRAEGVVGVPLWLLQLRRLGATRKP
jgi:hypothetical protein